MTDLLHLKINAPATLARARKPCKEGERLQTLCGLSPKSCTEILFNRATNLKKLGIRGRLALLLDGRTELLRKLANVKKLKLLNDVNTGSSTLNETLCFLPRPSQFPPRLRGLTLSATRLDWNQIAVLGSLDNLEELKLKDNAFVGDKWEVSGIGFPHLKVLHIQGADFTEWKCSSNHFIQLNKLQLSNCRNLMGIPSDFSGTNHNLNHIHLSKCSKPVADSAGRICDEMKQQRGITLALHIDV